MQDKMEDKTTWGITSSIFETWSRPWDVVQLLCHCRVDPSLSGITLFILTSGLDLGMWFDCWVTAEFPHPSEGVG